MDTLSIQIMFDDLGELMLKEGRTPDYIREFFMEEGDRVATEIEDAMLTTEGTEQPV